MISILTMVISQNLEYCMNEKGHSKCESTKGQWLITEIKSNFIRVIIKKVLSRSLLFEYVKNKRTM